MTLEIKDHNMKLEESSFVWSEYVPVIEQALYDNLVVHEIKNELKNINELLSMHDVCSCGTCATLRPKKEYLENFLSQQKSTKESNN